jgi:hypothetical protein
MQMGHGVVEVLKGGFAVCSGGAADAGWVLDVVANGLNAGVGGCDYIE